MRLLIGNDFNGDLRDDRTWVGWWVQRLVWFAQDNDIFVLPDEPQKEFFDYAAALMGTRPSSFKFLVPPPPGSGGTGGVTGEQLADRGFRDALRRVIGDEKVDGVFTLWPDASVARLARWLGVEDALPGCAFMAQGGGALVNSKAVFRSVAAGVGVPIPPGGVCASPRDAEELIMDLLDQGNLVMMKKEYLSGGRGNEILSPSTGVRPIGARRVVVVSDRDAVRSYLADRWEWLSSGGQHQVVVEAYCRDSSAVFVEFNITDEGIEFVGQGEIISAPYVVGEIMPAPRLETGTLKILVEEGHRLCEALRAMGYRGILSGDAVVVPGGEVFFTEYNGRITGSTHIYGAIGRRLVGEDYATRRVLLERMWPSEWSVPSFEQALDRIRDAGLGYDPASQTGVVLSSAFNERERSVIHVVVAEDVDAAYEQHAEVAKLFANGRA